MMYRDLGSRTQLGNFDNQAVIHGAEIMSLSNWLKQMRTEALKMLVAEANEILRRRKGNTYATPFRVFNPELPCFCTVEYGEKGFHSVLTPECEMHNNFSAR